MCESKEKLNEKLSRGEVVKRFMTPSGYNPCIGKSREKGEEY